MFFMWQIPWVEPRVEYLSIKDFENSREIKDEVLSQAKGECSTHNLSEKKD